MTSLIRYVAVAFALAACACGTNDFGVLEGAQGGGSTSDVATLNADLQVGSRGDDVRALHAYLTERGYFPNRELAQSRPTWRPVVPLAPADQAIYDERSKEAVSALQQHFGLPMTGIVDASTWELLRRPNCGVPESAPADPSEKFALSGSQWPYFPTIKWTLRNNSSFPIPSGLDPAAVRAAVIAALNTWAAESTLTFQEVPDTSPLPAGTILIGFVSTLPGGPNVINTVFGNTGLPNPTGTTWLELNKKVVWSTASTTPSTSMDLQSLVLHELGHALGLDHSGYSSATMYGAASYGKQRRSLSADDKVAISVLNDTWKQLPGAARDISINANLWIVGTAAAPGGYEIKKWNGSGWTVAGGNRGGVRVAADPAGGVWIVDQNGSIWVHGSNVASTTWRSVAGCASDLSITGHLLNLACGSPGCIPITYYDIWRIGCDTDGDGDSSIYRTSVTAGTTPSTNPSWLQDVAGRAWRIGVEREGIPWVVTGWGDIYRRTSERPDIGSYSFFGFDGYDVGAGPGPFAWVIAGSWTGNGYGIYAWNQQPPHAAAKPPAPEKYEWNFFDVGGVEITADSNGNPYVLMADQTIWTVNR